MRTALLLLTSCLVVAIVPGAIASERYATRPPVVMSPDLTAPWVMQLRQRPVGAPVNPHGYVVFSDPPVRAVKQRDRRAVRRDVDANPAVRDVSFQRPSQPAADTPPKQRGMDPKFLPQTVAYNGPEKPGTIVIDTSQRFLYLVEAGGTAQRYGVGVGKEGFGWSGTNAISRKAEWPDWYPPAQMIERERLKGRIIPAHMEGGVANPLGARALYLGSTLYRIHGTNAPWTIGHSVSSGCIRMRNEDVTDLYERVNVGTKVVVR
ncbi:L,D-transpeptidase [Phyllobacterium bourgognense]|uniref:Lipoprotein-anchoring transpeptidase ErfK/SrfK n=1 Tax=Phyllobacterium bourgognense TaxID=314236 RepID=A0A368Z5L4_9HYPH|nr:L,D-transpeptidase [Phyllobacterium bourgognense]RCW87740.1 lipoprotein-anchoring transpeptidase ErfK/SrfK [Phyllobacterium bourgognense]